MPGKACRVADIVTYKASMKELSLNLGSDYPSLVMKQDRVWGVHYNHQVKKYDAAARSNERD
jgi:hypothetical protein